MSFQVRMLLLAAPDAGRPPPEIVGAALKAQLAGVLCPDQRHCKCKLRLHHDS